MTPWRRVAPWARRANKGVVFGMLFGTRIHRWTSRFMCPSNMQIDSLRPRLACHMALRTVLALFRFTL